MLKLKQLFNLFVPTQPPNNKQCILQLYKRPTAAPLKYEQEKKKLWQKCVTWSPFIG